MGASSPSPVFNLTDTTGGVRITYGLVDPADESDDEDLDIISITSADAEAR